MKKNPTLAAVQKANAPTEAEIQGSICRYLAARGIRFTVTDASWRGGRRSHHKVAEGWPDVTACLPPSGQLLAIEVKDRKGKLREAQQRCLADLHRAGAKVMVARSVSDVQRALEA